MKQLTPIKAIRAFCSECAGTPREATTCTATAETCPLWIYRTGHRPGTMKARKDRKAKKEALFSSKTGSVATSQKTAKKIEILGEKRGQAPDFSKT